MIKVALLLLALVLFGFSLTPVLGGQQFFAASTWTQVGQIEAGGLLRFAWKPVCLGSYKIGDAFTNAINQKPTGLACVGPESTNFVPIPDTAFEENFRVGDITFYQSNNDTFQVLGHVIVSSKSGPDALKGYAAFAGSCLTGCVSPASTYTFNDTINVVRFDIFKGAAGFAVTSLFQLNNETATPAPFDYCLDQTCICDTCVNGTCTPYGNCACPDGWTGQRCDVDVDECDLQIDHCHPLAQCTNFAGGYSCSDCPFGYTTSLAGGVQKCTDIDECSNGTVLCTGLTPNCVNLPGSFVCNNCTGDQINGAGPGGCVDQFCGDTVIEIGEGCEYGDIGCVNCTCIAPQYVSTLNITDNCEVKCGNGRKDTGEECDGGVGCDPLSCLCKTEIGYAPSSTLNCAKLALTDGCSALSDCGECISLNCVWCTANATCAPTRTTTDCRTSCPIIITPSSTPFTPNANPQDPAPNNVIGTPGSKAEEDLIVGLVVGIGGAAIIAAVLLAVLLSRRNKKKKQALLTTSQRGLAGMSQSPASMSKYGIERTEMYTRSAAEEWVPPEDSIDVPLKSLPLDVSKETLDFGTGFNQFKVGQVYVDHFTLSYGGKKMKEDGMDFAFHVPHSPKFTISFNPEKGTVKKDKPVEIEVSLTMNMTTEMEVATGLEMPDQKTHCFFVLNVISEPSPLIDFDELVFDNNKVLGDGAYGTVYRGRYRGQDVAIKVLKMQDLPTEMLDEFDREIDLMTKLRHKNIVQFIGASKLLGKLAIVTEFIELGSVIAHLKKGGLDHGLKVKIALDAARAVNFLHQNRILHRDLKPDNLLLVSKSRDPSSVTVKLADFGTSRAVSEKMASKYTTGIGTPLYMAPEILAKKQYDLKADIFSFGVILWVLYAGKEPYSHLEHSWDVAKFVSEGNREEIGIDCPAGYKRIIEICWAQNPEERPTSEELLEELEQLYSKEKK
jgi:tRNA A-37 threonylcarbamoyl transferase component Bud32